MFHIISQMNPLKCKIWIYLEVYNIAATTAFIVLATRHLLPPPFHQWTGTALLLIIYWLPLIMYKTSQVCQMLEFISVLNYLHDTSMNAMRKHCYDNNVDPYTASRKESVATTSTKNAPSKSATTKNSLINHAPFTTITTAPLTATVVPTILPIHKPMSTSTPHIPYEWALIDSIGSGLP